MTDPRDLIQRLADALETYSFSQDYDMPASLTEARSYLAQPAPEGPTDEELWLVGDDAFRCNVCPTDAIKYARAVLARYGNHTSAPIPPSEPDRKSTRLNSSHVSESRMPSSA